VQVPLAALLHVLFLQITSGQVHATSWPQLLRTEVPHFDGVPAHVTLGGSGTQPQTFGVTAPQVFGAGQVTQFPPPTPQVVLVPRA
jgi:hypothetical protein